MRPDKRIIFIIGVREKLNLKSNTLIFFKMSISLKFLKACPLVEQNIRIIKMRFQLSLLPNIRIIKMRFQPSLE